MIRHPFENIEHELEDPEPIPCPRCGGVRGFTPIGFHHAHCLDCNALIQNKDITTHISKKETP